MKKILILTLIAFVFTGFAAAQAESYDEPAFYPLSPEYMAQGGSYTAVARGYNSLFTNPAGFAMPGGSLTLLSANVGMYMDVPAFIEDPDTVLGFFGADSNAMAGIIGLLGTHLKNGFGPDLTVGLGFAGRGLGLGVAANADLFMTNDLTADANFTVAIITGLAFPIKLAGTTLYVGADIRPMIRASIKNAAINDIMGFIDSLSDDSAAAPAGMNVYHGLGIALDAGVIWEAGPFRAGLALRDIGAKFAYKNTPADEFAAFLGTNSALPAEGEASTVLLEDSYTIPMSLRLGLAFHPDLGALKSLIDPMVHVEYRETFYTEEDSTEANQSFFTKLHAGAEVKLLSFLKLRGGLYQGYLTAGAGIKLLFLDVNVAYFSQEKGIVTGAKRSSGLTAEVALRF